MLSQHSLDDLKSRALTALESVGDTASLVEFQNLFFGRKNGELTLLLRDVKDLTPEEKKTVGAYANEVRIALEAAVAHKAKELQSKEWGTKLAAEALDVTQPALPHEAFGSLHPITIIQRDLEQFFTSLGFMVLDGPELESEYYNFTAVNIPPDHPARDMQDTFYIKDHFNWVMRTHTSSVQVRAMQKYGAPLRMIVPGRCFRNEATDVRHEHTFYQLEGVVIDKQINFAHMKGVLEAVAQHLYGPNTQVRLRPKFYPFVEPGVNGEVTCYLCGGSGCRLCKQTGWLEIFGAGMIHPNVLKEGGVDSNMYQGFAFGLGLTRLVMLKYGIDDIRNLMSGDIRFLQQF